MISNEPNLSLPISADQVPDIIVGGHDRLVVFGDWNEFHEGEDAKNLFRPLKLHLNRLFCSLQDLDLLVVELCEVERLDPEGRFAPVVAVALARGHFHVQYRGGLNDALYSVESEASASLATVPSRADL